MTGKRVFALLPLCVNGVPAREGRVNELPKMTHPGTSRAGIQIQFCDTTARVFWCPKNKVILAFVPESSAFLLKYG